MGITPRPQRSPRFGTLRTWHPLREAKLAPGEHDLSALARAHQVEAFLELLEWKAMRDHRRNIQSALNQRGHLIPCLIHLAAVNAADREHVEDNFVPVDRGL